MWPVGRRRGGKADFLERKGVVFPGVGASVEMVTA